MKNKHLPVALYSADQVKEIDRRAIEAYGIAAYTLMQRAAAAAFSLLEQYWLQTQHLWVLCGSGNNGGDGLVLARLARESGYKETVVLLCEPESLQGAAKQALDDYLAAGGQPLSMSPETMDRLVSEADVVVDALLGTGLTRPVTGDYLQLIDAVQCMSAAGVGLLSLDIPSGLHADTGAVMGAAIQADHTVSFIGLKLGLLTGAGPACTGELHFSNLDVPVAVYDDISPAALRMTDALRCDSLKSRSRIAHKGNHGRVICVGGDYGTSGAIRLAAEAALRTGAGLVSVATRPDVAIAMAQARPELMAMGASDAAAITQQAAAADVMVLGPGLGQGVWGQALFLAALSFDKALVLDADGLNLLVGHELKRHNWILTPHPGEAARLLATTTAKVQANRAAAVDALLEKFGGTVVLKGAGTLIRTVGGMLHLCSEGNPGMAVGGMGDVLSGIIAGLLAQGLDAETAACLGVYVHACAGDKAAAELGERGLLPSDLLPHLPALLNP